MPMGSITQVVVGESSTAAGYVYAFRTTANSAINPSTDNLGTLGGFNSVGGIESVAYGINNSGQVVGESITASGNDHAFRTAANSAINPSTDDLGTLGGPASIANGINNSGQVVGESFTSSGEVHAFLYDANNMYDLNSLASTLGDFSFLENATGINDSGQIVGVGFLANGFEHAFLATPVSIQSVPEPSNSSAIEALVVLGIGGKLVKKKLASKKLSA
jgi:probable HAF family extracellular repeat protein